MTKAPQDFETLRAEIAEQRDSLSKRLRQIATFALEHPTAMALETTSKIAQSADVQPSALIRFGQAFGYSGFSEMQKVFQDYITVQSAGYKERVRHELSKSTLIQAESPHSLLRQYCEANIVSLKHLADGIGAAELDKAVKLMAGARQIYLLGQRRSFPIVVYLSYALRRSDSRVCLLDGTGGMLMEQAGSMSREDILLAVSFHPYSEDTIEIVEQAHKRKIPCIAISDSEHGPVAENASVYLAVHDAEVHAFRSLAASLCLVQSLATSLAFRPRQGKPGRRTTKRSRKAAGQS